MTEVGICETIKAINTSDETIKKVREGKREMGTSDSDLLMWMWRNVALYAKFIIEPTLTAVAFSNAAHFFSWWKAHYCHTLSRIFLQLAKLT